MEDRRRPHATPEDPTDSTDPVRVVRQGSFPLPCSPATALALFTPEGERQWVDGWRPQYLSGASDEVGAVWRTSHREDTTWITTDRDDDRVRYARISGNGTAGLVEVLCRPAGAGTEVQVTYDLTVCNAAGAEALRRFAADFGAMLHHWQHATISALAGTPATDPAGDRAAHHH